jgi:hypothetical protein
MGGKPKQQTNYQNTYTGVNNGYDYHNEVNNQYNQNNQYNLPPMPKLESDMYKNHGNDHEINKDRWAVPANNSAQDYRGSYNTDNIENSNPNMNSIQNYATDYNQNKISSPPGQSIINQNENKRSINPYNHSVQNWQGNLSNNNYPSELLYSPIGRPYEGQDSKSTSFVAPVRFEDERGRPIVPTQIDWASNESHSQPLSPNAADEDEEEQEPRQMPVHVINHMAQFQSQKPQYQSKYQIPQARSSPKPT